ncbi:hypothetical protein [Singulisphaera sp. PoT]|uniref:hypothetical protein n=1 Tax=Singulisphaera sp. PoT TaxID=3411797 RepID=UPI003BF5F596
MDIVIDLGTTVLIAGMVYALSSEGLWGAVLMFFNIVFGGLIAFNFYEYLAQQLDSTGIGWGFSDSLCLLVLFIVSVLLLRLTTETLAPAMVRYPSPIYQLGRFTFAVLGSLVLGAIILLSFDCAPVHKKVFGVIDYKKKVPFGLGLERRWLAFFQHTTGLIFAQREPGLNDPYREFSNAKVFDPRGEWLLQHQQARPYGTESVLEDAGAAAEGAPSGGPTGPGGGPTPPQGGPAGPGGPMGQQGGPRVIAPGPGGGVVMPGGPM